MLEQLQQAYQKALGNVIFVDFKRKKIVKRGECNGNYIETIY